MLSTAAPRGAGKWLICVPAKYAVVCRLSATQLPRETKATVFDHEISAAMKPRFPEHERVTSEREPIYFVVREPFTDSTLDAVRHESNMQSPRSHVRSTWTGELARVHPPFTFLAGARSYRQRARCRDQ